MKSKMQVKVKRMIGGRYYERKITPYSLLTTMETAKLLGVTQRHVYNLSKAKVFPTIQKGKGKLKRIFFVFKDVKNYLEGRR